MVRAGLVSKVRERNAGRNSFEVGFRMVEEDAPLNRMAQRLVAHEAGDIHDALHLTEATNRIFQRIQGQLTTYVGPKGYRAVLRRALQLAQQGKSPLLAGIGPSLEEEEGLRALSERLKGLNDANAEKAVISLLTSFFGVVTELLGWDFTCRLVTTAWAELTFSEECS